MEQLRADDRLLHVLLREGTVGSDAFKRAVDRELGFFEEELRIDLIRFAKADGVTLHEPALAARAITRLAFAMGAGLSITAITNTCLMGMMLAKLPYNRGPACDAPSIVAQLAGSGRRS